MNNLIEILNGGLLGDASIRVKGKYQWFSWVAKDKNLLQFIKNKLRNLGINNTYISVSNKKSKTYLLGFYMNKYPELLRLREKWYINLNGKTQKVIPKDLKLTQTTLLYWYLGDGSLIRHKNPSRVPWIVLATNNFLREDVETLIKKLKKLNLNFYPVKYRSGFKKGKECGYALVSKVSDATVYNFFKLIGFRPPKEIENCITGRKGKESKLHFIKDKWPKDDEWIKIISNIPNLGLVLKIKEIRKRIGLTQKELGKRIGISREAIRDFENGKRNLRVDNLRKLLKSLKLTYRSNFHCFNFQSIVF